MSLGLTIVCGLAVQQLAVAPFPATVGEPVVVTVRRDGAPLVGIEFAVDLPAGISRACGATGADGNLRFLPEVAGDHLFVATIGGVRQLLPLAVRPRVDKWPLAIASVPLGLALLWWHLSRVRGRRAP